MYNSINHLAAFRGIKVSLPIAAMAVGMISVSEAVLVVPVWFVKVTKSDGCIKA